MKHNYYKNIDGWFDFARFYDYVLKQFDSGTFVEIGTWKGRSLMYMAEKIKESGKNITLYGIDTFRGSDSTPAMGDIVEMKKKSQDYFYETYLKNIEPLKDYIKTIRGDSKVVHDQFADGSIDFLFIDGDHSYEAVKTDIINWYPKVKQGGIISGHDYTTDYGYGVVDAVNQLFDGSKIKLWPPYVWQFNKSNKYLNPMSIHPKGYWLEVEGPNTHTCDKQLCEAITDVIKDLGIKTAVDIGCGAGAYTRHLIDHGIDCEGFDGSPKTPELSNGLCRVLDFADPQDIGQFDLVLSLEVGEHIPKKWEQIFIDNVCRAANKYICMCWAIEGQPGYGHFNCQNNDYVINEMAKRDFAYCPETSHYIREASDKVNFPWFYNTIMFFKKV